MCPSQSFYLPMYSLITLEMCPKASFLPLLLQIYPCSVSSLHQGIQMHCRTCWYLHSLCQLQTGSQWVLVFFSPWHTSQSSLTLVVRLLRRRAEYDFVLVDRWKQQGFLLFLLQGSKASAAARATCLMQPKSTTSALQPPGFHSSDANPAMKIQVTTFFMTSLQNTA